MQPIERSTSPTRNPAVAMRPLRRWPWLAGLLWLAACGSDQPSAPVSPPANPQAASPQLVPTRTGELLAYVQQKLGQREARLASAATGGTAAADPSTAGGASAAPVVSSTTLQEGGVDEPDLLKAATAVGAGGALQLHALTTNTATPALLTQARAAGQAPGSTQSLALAADGSAALTASGLVLTPDGQGLVTIAQGWWTGAADALPGGSTPAPGTVVNDPRVLLQRFDTRQPGTAVAAERISLQGTLVASRRVGNTLLVVTRHQPGAMVAALSATTAAARQAATAALTTADLLPQLRRNGGAAQPLLADSDCWAQPGNGSESVQITTLTAIDLATTGLPTRSRCFAGGTEALYMTPDTVVLATSRWTWTSPPVTPGMPSLTVVWPEATQTDLHKFAFDANAVAGGGTWLAYRGSGSVDGHLGWDPARAPYRLSAHQGDLRVLTFTGSQGWATVADATSLAASPARLSVLREGRNAAGEAVLLTVATLPNAQQTAALGKPGEQVYGVRFAGERAYLVTFRRTDPLYVLDLANPLQPRVAGVLEVPGFSDWLYPLPNGLLFGVGQDADVEGRATGLKLALFDVADASAPRLLNSVALGEAGSQSALAFSPHGLALLPPTASDARARMALPVNLLKAGAPQAAVLFATVDTAARTLTVSAPQAQAAAGLWVDLYGQRAVLVDDEAVLLREGSFQWLAQPL